MHKGELRVQPAADLASKPIMLSKAYAQTTRGLMYFENWIKCSKKCALTVIAYLMRPDARECLESQL